MKIRAMFVAVLAFFALPVAAQHDKYHLEDIEQLRDVIPPTASHSVKDTSGNRWCERAVLARLEEVDAGPLTLMATAAYELQVWPIVVAANSGQHRYFRWVYGSLGDVWGRHAFEQLSSFERVMAVATYSDADRQSYFIAFYGIKNARTYKLEYELPMSFCPLPDKDTRRLVRRSVLVDVDTPRLQAAILRGLETAPQRNKPKK